MASASHGMFGRTAGLRQLNASYRSHPSTHHARKCRTSWYGARNWAYYPTVPATNAKFMLVQCICSAFVLTPHSLIRIAALYKVVRSVAQGTAA